MKTIMKILILGGIIILTAFSCEKDKKNEIFSEIDFLKFSDFGCEDYSCYLKPEYTGNNFIITSQEEFERYVTGSCIPKIDFTKYFVIIGIKNFTTGSSFYNEKVEESDSEIVYTITFLTYDTAVAEGVAYHVVIEKLYGEKRIRIVEIVKE